MNRLNGKEDLVAVLAAIAAIIVIALLVHK